MYVCIEVGYIHNVGYIYGGFALHAQYVRFQPTLITVGPDPCDSAPICLPKGETSDAWYTQVVHDLQQQLLAHAPGLSRQLQQEQHWGHSWESPPPQTPGARNARLGGQPASATAGEWAALRSQFSCNLDVLFVPEGIPCHLLRSMSSRLIRRELKAWAGHFVLPGVGTRMHMGVSAGGTITGPSG
jgi:hypothetical protein